MGRSEQAGTLDEDARQRRSAGVPVYDLDFEDGILPPVFSQGHVVPCGGGRENQYCLVGTVRPWWGRRNVVTLGDTMNKSDVVFQYSRSMVISFDYWLGGDAVDATGSYAIVWYLGIILGLASAAVHLPIKEIAAGNFQPARA